MDQIEGEEWGRMVGVKGGERGGKQLTMFNIHNTTQY
jgi:hypothetical protein